MKTSFVVSNVIVGMAICGCSSHSEPKAIKWDFSNGMGNWQTLHSEVAEIVNGPGDTFLTLKNLELQDPHRFDGGMWTHVQLGRSAAQQVSLLVAARTNGPRLSINIHITCQTGKQDGPTYGVLLSDSVNEPLTAEWATHKMTLDIPDGTRELEFGIGINPPDVNASIDIRTIECLIDGKGNG